MFNYILILVLLVLGCGGAEPTNIKYNECSYIYKETKDTLQSKWTEKFYNCNISAYYCMQSCSTENDVCTTAYKNMLTVCGYI